MGTHLELGNHSNFTEAFGVQVLRFIVSEDLVQQEVVRPLEQADELWRQRILSHRNQMKLWSTSSTDRSKALHTHLVLFDHPLYLVLDFASVMSHREVRLMAELVPADVGVFTELLLQTNPECLCIRGSIKTTLLQAGKKHRNTNLFRILHHPPFSFHFLLFGSLKNADKENEQHTSLRRENTLTGLPSMRSRQLWLSWYLTKDHWSPSDTYSS